MIKSREIKLFLFPLLIIPIYELFAIYISQHAQKLGALHEYFVFLSGLMFLISGVLSDKFCRKKILLVGFLAGIVCFSLMYVGYVSLAIIISPLFFTTPVARAALIDNHQNLSVKNLIAISYIVLFIPWSFFSEINFLNTKHLASILIIMGVISIFLFKDDRDLTKERKIVVKINNKKFKNIIFLAIALGFAQLIFFLIFNKVDNENIKNHLFDLIGIGSLIGAILCLLSSGKPDTLITASYTFLLLYVIGTLLTYYFWRGHCWEISLAQIGILGGFYLPFVTEQAARILGNSSRGLACGLVDFIVTISSILSLLIFKSIKDDFVFIICLLIFSVIVYILHSLRKGMRDDSHFTQRNTPRS